MIRTTSLQFLLLFLIAFSAFSVQQAKASDSLVYKARTDTLSSSRFFTSLPGHNFALVSSNAPLMLYAEGRNQTAISWGLFHRNDRQETLMPQLGDRDSEGNMKVHSSYRTSNSYAWGKAGYSYRETANIRFNQTNDYALLAPYVMGDTAQTAPLKQHYYHFDAGYSHQMGKWLVGATASYRANFAFRSSDPRPNNLSTFLQGSLGVGYTLQNYAVGVSAGIGRYKQSNHVAFMNELGVSTEYHFIGLGADYFRFRGNQTALFYDGLSYTLSLGLTPKGIGRSGFFFYADWQLFDVKRIIRPLNNLPLSRLHHHYLDASMGYLGEVRNNQARWGVALFATGEMQRGTINIFGSAVGDLYPLIAKEPRLFGTDLTLGARAFLQWKSPRRDHHWGVSTTIGYHLYQLELLPQSHERYNHLIAMLAPFYSYQKDLWELFLKPQIVARFATPNPQLQLASQNTPPIGYHELLEKTFHLQASTRYDYGLSLGVAYQLGRQYALTLASSYMLTSGAQLATHRIALYLGLVF